MAGSTPNETKSDKFKRLATQRMNNTLKQIELIGNLSNRLNYEYTDEQVNKIFTALEQSIKEAKDKFKTGDKKDKRFEL